MNTFTEINNLSIKEAANNNKSVKIDFSKNGYVLLGHRIPKDFFITKGTGESDITIHAGSYHLALKQAGIEMCNIMVYSSILPKVAREIAKPATLTHGAVMECIMATANSSKDRRATAAIMFGRLYHKKTGERFGGLVCEYDGTDTESEAIEQLRQSLNELYVNGYSEEYHLKDIRTITESFIPQKKYGTAVVALCFTNYIYPILS